MTDFSGATKRSLFRNNFLGWSLFVLYWLMAVLSGDRKEMRHEF